MMVDTDKDEVRTAGEAQTRCPGGSTLATAASGCGSMRSARSAIADFEGAASSGDDACRPSNVRRPRRRQQNTSGAAHYAVRQAIVRGEIPQYPPACEVCGVAGRFYGQPRREYRTVEGVRVLIEATQVWSVERHHHSYEPAFHLDTVDVCKSCHLAIHRGRIPEPRTGEYRAGRNERGRGWRMRKLAAPTIRASHAQRNWAPVRTVRPPERTTTPPRRERSGGAA